MASQNLALPIQEQLDTLFSPRWAGEEHTSLCLEEVLWTTAHWISVDSPPITTQFANTVFNMLEPFIEEWETALRKVGQ